MKIIILAVILLLVLGIGILIGNSLKNYVISNRRIRESNTKRRI